MISVRIDRCPEGRRRLALVARGKTCGRRMRASQDRRERLDDIARRGDEAGALLQEIVGAGGARIERTAGHGEHFSSLFAGKPRRDQRTRTLGRLDHHYAERDSGNQPVAPGKVLAARREAGRTLADEKTAFSDRLLQLRVLRRIDHVNAAGHHGNRARCGARQCRCPARVPRQ